MAFNLVYLSQNDPQWRNDRLGFGDPGDTIGKYGCALTSVAMLLCGHGISETPQSLNRKMQDRNGFISSLIRWDVVSQIHSQVRLRQIVDCRDSEAPLAQIDASLAAGQPVVVLVDNDRDPDLDWHYVMLYAREGSDYLMLDPWPYTPGTDRKDYLMGRYGYGRPLKRAIRQVLFYEVAGSGGPIATPSTPQTQPTPVPVPTDGIYARVMDSVTLGLNIRSSTDTSSLANLVINVPPGTLLKIVNSSEAVKIGEFNQWVRVSEPGGKEGFAAAWFLERVSAPTPTPVPEPVPSPTNEAPIPTPSTPETPATPPIESTPTPSTPTPAPQPAKVQVVVRGSGTKVFTTLTSSTFIATEKGGARLTVLEPVDMAKAKIGVKGKRINVKASNNKRGFIEGDKVRLA